MYFRLFAFAGIALLAYVTYKLTRLVYHYYASPLRHLPGPKGTSWFYGNLGDIFKADNSVLHEEWAEQYGQTLKYHGWLYSHRLFTMDTKALNYILTHPDDYQKPGQVRYNLSRVFGEGVLFVEGDQHRHQRRIMNPAFGPAQVRALTDIFVEKAIQLRDVMSLEISKTDEPSTRIDVLSLLGKTTLDVIGLAGFNYRFDALNVEAKPNELNQALNVMFSAGQRMNILPILQAWFPLIRHIPTKRRRNVDRAQATMARIGNDLLNEAKASFVSSEKDGVTVQKSRDLLSLLVHANMSSDVKEGQRLSDKDVLAQVPTFVVAGHETTSSATTWALFALTQAPEVQAKLRAELIAVPTSTPTMDELNALPYLDSVVRETLRIHAPVPSTIRIAMRDDVLPLNQPFVDKKGRTHNVIKVSKGDEMFIPILAINRSKALWGEDAREFKPERWQSVPETVGSIPGVWGNMLTFLGGPRSCIGYRFSLIETKALLFTLVRSFEFELAVSPKDIIAKSGIVQRPFVITELDRGSQLPLLIKRVTSQT